MMIKFKGRLDKEREKLLKLLDEPNIKKKEIILNFR